MFAVPTDENGQPVTEEKAPNRSINGVEIFSTNVEGKFTYPSSLTAFFVQSQDGTEVAFVPPGAKFPVRLRKCAKLKITNSILSKQPGFSDKGRVTVVWKNCLAGSYPLLYPAESDLKTDPDLPLSLIHI